MSPKSKEISILQLLLHRWKMSVFVVACCVALAGLITLAMPRRYEAGMKFLVNNERADLVITPEKAPSYAPPPQVTESDVNSEIEVLKSQDLLEDVVRDAKLYNVPNKKVANPSRLIVGRALRDLQRDLKIEVLHKTNIVAVTYHAADPDLAVAVLRDLGERYLTAHLAAHSTPGTYNFFTQQVARYSAQLASARQALTVFHQNTLLFSMPQQQSAAIAQLEAVQAQMKSVEADIEEQQSRLNENQEQLTALPERSTTQERSVPNQFAIEHLQSLLADLRNKRIDLVTKFKPSDRFVIELDQQIASTEDQLAELKNNPATERTTDLDALHQSLKSDQVKGAIALKALESRRTELASMRLGYLAELNKMDRNYATLQDLEQSEKEALENYALYSRRLDEARLADSLDQQKFSNVAMIEKPIASPIPVSPKLSLNLGVGALMGFFLSLSLAFYAESKGGGELASQAANSTFFVVPPYQPQVSGD